MPVDGCDEGSEAVQCVVWSALLPSTAGCDRLIHDAHDERVVGIRWPTRLLHAVQGEVG